MIRKPYVLETSYIDLDDIKLRVALKDRTIQHLFYRCASCLVPSEYSMETDQMVFRFESALCSIHHIQQDGTVYYVCSKCNTLHETLPKLELKQIKNITYKYTQTGETLFFVLIGIFIGMMIGITLVATMGC